MAEVLQLVNFGDANKRELSQLAADITAAAVTFTVVNADGLAVDDFGTIGLPGAEDTEVRRTTGLTSKTLTVSALSNDHKKFEPYQKLFGDKIKVYRAANVDGTQPADASFSNIATVTIEADQLFTLYTDSTGGSDYWYKQTYYNSVALTETTLASSPATRGGEVNKYCTIEEIRSHAQMVDAQFLTDANISLYRNMAQSQIDGVLVSAKYTLPLTFVPSVVALINRLIAAGHILLPQYRENGLELIAQGEKLLTEILEGRLVLTDISSAQLSATSTITGWPDNTTDTASDADAGGPHYVTRLQKLQTDSSNEGAS